MHWFLPFLSLFLVAFGGWAIGMRNLIIYELEADYASYLDALGAPRKLVRRYAFRNALLPQLTGLALQLGVLVAGALVTEIVFAYPGLGHLILQAIQNQDFFLLQGAFLFIVIGVLVGELRHRHRLRRGRPAHADRDAGESGMTVEKAKTALAAPAAPPLVAAPPVGRTREALYFALRNPKVVGGAGGHPRVPRAGAGRAAVHRPRPQRVRRPAGGAAVGATSGSAPPRSGRTCSSSSPTASARRSWSACSAAGSPR